MIIQRALVLSLVFVVGLAARPTQAQVPFFANESDCYRFYYGLNAAKSEVIRAKGAASSLEMDPVGEWSDFENADFVARQDRASSNFGFATWTYMENLQGVVADTLLDAARRPTQPLNQNYIDGTIAKAAICDRVLGIPSPLSPSNDRAKEVMALAQKAASVSPSETLQCNRVYEGGQKNWTIKQQPVAALFTGAADADFFSRTTLIDHRSDLISAESNTPSGQLYVAEDAKWENRLSKAIEAEDAKTQLEFWSEVAACDAKLGMGEGRFKARPPVSPGPLIEPNVSHLDCAANYAALGQVYSSNPQAKGYFDQRGLNAARYVNLFGDFNADQEVIAQVNKSALERMNTYQKPDATIDAGKIMQTFEETRVCDQQYGLPATTIPEDLYRQARMDR